MSLLIFPFLFIGIDYILHLALEHGLVGIHHEIPLSFGELISEVVSHLFQILIELPEREGRGRVGQLLNSSGVSSHRLGCLGFYRYTDQSQREDCDAENCCFFYGCFFIGE